mgnify:CR=1 FL=1
MSRTSGCATSARRTTRTARCTRRLCNSNEPPGFERGDTPEMKLRKIEALLAPTSSPIADRAPRRRVADIFPAGDLYASDAS